MTQDTEQPAQESDPEATGEDHPTAASDGADRPTIKDRWDSDRVELIATVVLAIAAILTAWSAFQSSKWSGEQATKFSQAGATRTESVRADTAGGQLVSIDVTLFVDWIAALNQDINNGVIPDDIPNYEPTKGTVSGFLFTRFRDEFKPAMAAWLATDPAANVDAPPTPFSMPEYVVAELVRATELQADADAFASDARDANQTSDNYVLTAVLFATVLFFAGVSSKLTKPRNRAILVTMSVIILISASVILLSLPRLL